MSGAPTLYVYRWGVNDDRWESAAPPAREALEELRWVARNKKLVEWSLGKGKAPPYARQIRVGDVVLLYAGSKFDPRGVYAIAGAGDEDSDEGELAVRGKNWRLPLRVLPVSAKLADAPVTGLDSVFAPPGPAATLLRLKKPSQPVIALARWALGELVNRPAIAAAPKSRTADKTDHGRMGKLLDELPDSERRKVIREIESVIRDARLRSRALDLWGPKCAACGHYIEASPTIYDCEIAHIREVWDGGKDQVSNALPLCRIHHWAFDRDIWAIHPGTLVVVVANKWRSHPSLRKIHDRRIKRPAAPLGIEPLSPSALRYRWARFAKSRL